MEDLSIDIPLRYILSYRAWNLRVALCLAARHNVLWNSRAFSLGLLASGIPSLFPPYMAMEHALSVRSTTSLFNEGEYL